MDNPETSETFPPKETADDLKNIQVIAHIIDNEEARIAAGFLKSQGFAIELFDAHALDVLPFHAVALGGYRLAIIDGSAEDVCTAKKLLADINTSWTKAGNHKRTCLKCGAQMRLSPSRLLTSISIFGLFSIPYLLRNKTFTCGSCRHTVPDSPD